MTDLVNLVPVVRQATVAYRRPDLTGRVDRLAAGLGGETRVVVAGEFKAGKSSLVNALLGTEICPVDDDLATTLPIVVTHADALRTDALVLRNGGVERQALSPGRLHDCVTARTGETTDWFAVEVGLPARELSRGLVLIDTAGVGGVVAALRASTLGMVDDADAVLFATDAAGELTAPELEMIVAIRRRCPELVIVVTKTDLYPAWRAMVERNVGHLQCAGVESPVIAVSSALRSAAVARADQTLNNESGFGDLAQVLRNRVLDASEQRRLRRIHRVLASVVEELVEAFTIERMALGDSDALAEVAAEAAASAVRSEAALDRSARWQVLLNDGMKDLVSDVEHDLRGGFRALTESADERIDQLDPRRDWDDFAAWLHGSIEDVVLGNQRLLADRVEALARDVEHVFVVDGEAPTTPTLAIGSDDSFGRSTGTDPTFEAAGVLRSVLGGLRGSYSGLLMFGALGGLAGVAVATPVLVGIGLLLGARQVGDERDRQLKAHRQQALVATKRTIDGVSFSVNKATRDHTNAAQRLLRDHYTQRAADLREAAKLTQAEIGRLRSDRDERASRAAALGAELRRLDELRRRLDGAVSPSVPSRKSAGEFDVA